MTAPPASPPSPAELDAARLLLARMGISPADLAVAENLVRAGQSRFAPILFCATPHRSASPTTASRGWLVVLIRLAYLGVTNVFALLRLLPMSDHDKDVEILALRHQITVPQRQLGPTKPRFQPSDRALLAALLHRLQRSVLRQAQASTNAVVSQLRSHLLRSHCF
jgi:hypothetical protein